MGDYHLCQEITRTNYRDITNYNRYAEKIAYLPRWFLRADINKLIDTSDSGLNFAILEYSIPLEFNSQNLLTCMLIYKFGNNVISFPLDFYKYEKS